MANARYRKGADGENRAAAFLRSEGWVVVRAAGSKGPFDLTALKRGHRSRLCEVKAGKTGPYQNFPPQHRDELEEVAWAAGADAFLIWTPTPSRIELIPASEWPVNHRVRPDYRVDDETGCWVWRKHITKEGYGKTGENRRSLLAHRKFYQRLVGPIPPGKVLDHLCGNRACVNPEHLEPVERAENNRRGSLAKLTAEDVAVIRQSSKGNVELAGEYGVGRSHIWGIRSGRTWADIKA